jgi:hypothetical protein
VLLQYGLPLCAVDWQSANRLDTRYRPDPSGNNSILPLTSEYS